MSGSEFQEIWRTINEILRRLDDLELSVGRLERQPASEFCACTDDWTDGTGYCQACHKPKPVRPADKENA
jgi:hypothetical protein